MQTRLMKACQRNWAGGGARFGFRWTAGVDARRSYFKASRRTVGFCHRHAIGPRIDHALPEYTASCRRLDYGVHKMRVVSLLPAATEIVGVLGQLDTLVGVSHECDFPPEVNAKAR